MTQRLPILYLLLIVLASTAVAHSQTWKPIVAGGAAVYMTLEGIGRLIDAGLTTEQIAQQLPPVGGASHPARPVYPNCAGYGCAAMQKCTDSVIHGSWATKVWKVDSLKAQGVGSLAAAFDSTNNSVLDIIVFDTSGVVTNGSGRNAWLFNDCVFIAGKTAPGGGIAYYNSTSVNQGYMGIGDGNSNDPANNVVLSGLNLWKDEGSPSSQQNNLGIWNGENILIDHNSLIGAEDQVLDITSGRGGFMDNVTVSNNIIASAWTTALATFVQVGITTTSGNVRYVDYHNNVFPHPNYRTPALSHSGSRLPEDDTIDVVMLSRNVMYDNASRWIIFQAYVDTFALENNTFKFHGSTGASERDDVVELDTDLGSDTGNPDTVSWHMIFSGNDHTGGVCGATDRDWWTQCTQSAANTAIGDDSIGHSSASMPKAPTYDYPSQTAAQAYSKLIGDRRVGVDSLLNDTACDGTFEFALNSQDSLLLDDVEDSTVVMAPVAFASDNANMFPTLAAGSACTDTDGDGMPDTYEDAQGLDKNSFADVDADPDADGWINFFEYYNGTDPNNFTEIDGTENPGGPEGDPADETRLNTGIRSAFSVFMRSVIWVITYPIVGWW